MHCFGARGLRLRAEWAVIVLFFAVGLCSVLSVGGVTRLIEYCAALYIEEHACGTLERLTLLVDYGGDKGVFAAV